MELLAIPSKRTLQFNLGEKLAQLIDSTFYQTSNSFDSDLKEITIIRDEIASNNDISLGQVEHMYKYLNILRQLKKKFPMDQIQFSWCQTISTKSNTKGYSSLEWEESNIIYNLGAMYSLLSSETGMAQDMLNTKYKYYQMAATMFNHVNMRDSKFDAVDEETAMALTNLMLSQGMECFWSKAKGKDNIKHLMLARLSSQVVIYYDKTFQYAKRSPLIKSDWIDHFKQKMIYFEVVTYYRMALDMQENQKWGEMVRTLTHCVSLLSNCRLDTSQQFLQMLKELLNEISKDNDFIYLQMVPDIVAPIAKPLNMIELLDFDTVIAVGTQKWQNDIYFKNLLPLELIDSCNAYNERQSQYVSEQIIQPITTLIKELNSKLNESLKSQTIVGIPLDINEITSLDASLNNFNSMNESIQSKLVIIKQILDDEVESDKLLRSNHGLLHWSLPKSEDVNINLLTKLNQLKQYLIQATNTDKETLEVLNMIDHDLLTTDPAEHLAKMKCNNEDPLSKEIKDVQTNRDIFIRKVQEKVTENSVLLKMIKSYRENNEVVDQTKMESQFQEHLTIFQNDLMRVNKERATNRQLLQQLENAGNNSATTETMKRLTPKDLYIEEVKYSLGLLGQVKESITNGARFYNDLLTSTNSLLSETEQFNETRKIEKKRLNDQLMNA